MHYEALKTSVCRECLHKEYERVWNTVGQAYRNYQCLYPDNRHKFGMVRRAEDCRDFESEAGYVEE